MEIKEKEKKEEESVKSKLVNYAITQIIHIARYGCNGIKCKRCSLNNLCEDRKPLNSRNLAQKVITYANLSEESN